MGLLLKYWVCNPRGDDPHAVASREAMRRYAYAIHGTDPELAAALVEWVRVEWERAEKGAA